jgi:transposase
VPVGHEVTRTVFGLVTTLPHSAAHAVVFTHTKTLFDFLPALLGCLTRLGGSPQSLALDNDTSMVLRVPGHRSRLHPEAAALFGALCVKPIILPPRRPTSKGSVERTVEYLETSFLPLRHFSDIADLQSQGPAQVFWAPAICAAPTQRGSAPISNRIRRALFLSSPWPGNSVAF